MIRMTKNISKKARRNIKFIITNMPIGMLSIVDNIIFTASSPKYLKSDLGKTAMGAYQPKYNRIYIYNVNRFENLRYLASTIAHELAHAMWYLRMTNREKRLFKSFSFEEGAVSGYVKMFDDKKQKVEENFSEYFGFIYRFDIKPTVFARKQFVKVQNAIHKKSYEFVLKMIQKYGREV